MAYSTGEGAGLVYEAAERFVEAALRSDGSLFTPERAIFSATNLDELHRRFNEQPDEGSSSFLEKFERQLAGAPDVVIQLAAELVYVHLLVAVDIGGPSKRATIERVLGWMEAPVAIPPELDTALDHGLANTGVAFKTYRPHQLWLLIDALRAWKQLGESRREQLLADPWQFKDFLFGLPLTAAYTQREALLHLVHPEAFQNIVSRDHKRLIAESFNDRLAEQTDDVDRALAQIRESLQEERSDFGNFYESGVVEVWRPKESAEAPTQRETGSTRAWLVRHKVAGRPRLDQWLESGYASIGWGRLGDVVGASREEIAARLQTAYPDQPAGWMRNSAGNIDRFLNEMAIGDLVVTPEGQDIYVGIVDSAPSFVEGSEEAHRRTVEWANPGDPIARGALSVRAYSKLRTLLTVTDVTEDLTEFARRAGVDLSEVEAPPRPIADVPSSLRAADSDLADRLLLPQAWLQEVIDLLDRKRQVVFYGPPGTGKTYVAQRLADHLTAAGGTPVLVQFHPSYAYEDFFEGFRPRSSAGEGGVTFELVPGPLRRIAEEARDNPENVYVLIIDELNRANLAKVFGELYFLLEYREQAVALQYSPEDEFSLPRNLLLIGTMNTADRSIALVDAAMRRRFYFVEFFPQRPPIEALLRAWLLQRNRDEAPADLLDELNARLDDEDFAVGPSYLMNDEASSPEGLERIWRHAVLPLLEEHHFGTGVDVAARFGLAALRKAVAAASSAPVPAQVGDPAEAAVIDQDEDGETPPPA